MRPRQQEENARSVPRHEPSILPGVVARILKLEKGGISGNMFNWAADFLQEVGTVKVNGTRSESTKSPLGTPQGSVISPLLFLCMMNDLHTEIKRLKVSLFADDTTIHFSHKNLKFAEKRCKRT
jgi:retron-type reverse transcriptase